MAKVEQVEQRLLSVVQAARYLGTTEAGVRGLIQRGELATCVVKIGRSVRLDLNKLDQWIEARRTL